MKKTSRIIAALAALLCLSLPAYAQEGMETFMARLAENATVKSIDSRFTQTRSMAVFASDVVKEGNFSFRRPEEIRMDFDDGDYIHISDKEFEMLSEGRLSRAKSSSNPMLGGLKRMLAACLSGDMKALVNGFESSLDEDAASYTLTLVPAARQRCMFSSLVLCFDKKDMSLDTMKMCEAGGDSTSWSFTRKKIVK